MKTKENRESMFYSFEWKGYTIQNIQKVIK